MAFLQRSILSTDVIDDVGDRLKYYEEARGRNLPHLGAVFLATDVESSEIIGFADVGLTLYDTRKRQFRLPKRPEGDWGPSLYGVDRPARRPSAPVAEAVPK